MDMGGRVWETRKLGIVKYVWVCVYAPVNVTNGRWEEMRKFWNDVNECLRKLEGGRMIVFMGDMNGKVQNGEVMGGRKVGCRGSK